MTTAPPFSHPDPNFSWLHRWIYYLAAIFLIAAVTLRSLLVFQGEPFLWQILVLLAILSIAFLVGSLPLKRLPWLAALLTAVVAVLPLIFLYLLKVDYFACLFALLGMQAMRRYTHWIVVGLLIVPPVLTFLLLKDSYGTPESLALALVYAAASVFIAAYIWSTRRSQAIQLEQQALMAELQEANSKLEALVSQQEQLVAGRERQRLARELHDSVTQSVFSMTLTTQSAILLLDRDPRQVRDKLDRLDQLVHSAMSEMQELISHLANEPVASENFLSVLRSHIEERGRLDGLSVNVEVEGSQPLDLKEETGLLRIIQEALNNIVKHACVSQASIRLHLNEKPWMDIEDLGVGFDLQQVHGDGRMGLIGMRERAIEIGWVLEVESQPGRGTCIHVEKVQEG